MEIYELSSPFTFIPLPFAFILSPFTFIAFSLFTFIHLNPTKTVILKSRSLRRIRPG